MCQRVLDHVRKNGNREKFQTLFIVTLVLFVGVFTSPSTRPNAQSDPNAPLQYEPERQYRGQKVWDLPTIPEEKIDIGLWALVIAKECDSTIDIDHYLATLDSLSSAVKYMVGPRDLDMVKFAMTKMYLYDTGTWNDGRIYAYDLEDPLGEQPHAPLLTTYLDTRLGNCVSMPTLLLSLMERVDPNVSFRAALAPRHVYCRLHDRQDTTVWNVEPTNGGHFMRDEWVVESFAIPQEAIDSGSYMRDLSKREFVAELLDAPIAKLRAAGEYEKALTLADLQVELSPRSLSGLINKAALLAWLGYNLHQDIAQSGHEPSLDEISMLEHFQVKSDSLVLRALSLGWSDETPESRARYIQTVAEAKQKR